MKITAARLHAYRLRLRAPIETAHGRLLERQGYVLELEAEDGPRGHGDACPIAGFGMEDTARCEAVLARLGTTAVGRAAQADVVVALLDQADREAPDAPGARGALEVALRDLCARIAGVPLAAALAGSDPGAWPRELPVAALVVDLAPEAVRESAGRLRAEGFETLKLKVGGRAWAEDRARVRAAREGAGDAVRLRLDANAGWSEAEARRILAELGDQGVELVEQPVAAGDVDALARLRAPGAVPIAADESASSLAGARRVLEADAADVVVLKPAALGGPTRALAVAEAARQRGVSVFVTSLLDSALGVAAAAHVAAALPGGRPADGLATGALAAFDVAPALPIVRGRLVLSGAPGLGVEPDPQTWSRVSCAPPRELTS